LDIFAPIPFTTILGLIKLAVGLVFLFI